MLEKQCPLGGLATLGLIVMYLPLCDGYGRQRVGGIGKELLLAGVEAGELFYPGGEAPPLCRMPEA